MSLGSLRARDRRDVGMDDDDDAWNDDALVRAYDEAISRHGGSGRARGGTERGRRASGTRTREADADDARASASTPTFDPRSFESARRVGSPRASPRVGGGWYGEEGREDEDARGWRGGAAAAARGYDPYDAYEGHYARGDDRYDERYGYLEDEFARFSPFRRGRGPMAPARGPPPPLERYRRAPPTSRASRGPPRPPPDMVESAYETARSYEEDGYDPDELANLLLAWYYAGYYTGSFSRNPPPADSFPGR